MKISNNIVPSYNVQNSSQDEKTTKTTATTTVTTAPKTNVGNPSFGSGNIANRFNEFFKLEKSGPMTRSLFIFNAFTFLLGSRIFTSRDKDERRETIIRDVPTILISVAGVPAITSVAEKAIEQKTGFAISEKFMDKGKQKAKDIHYSSINDWYQYDKNLDGKGGIKASLQRLSDMGGNVKKICSTLSDTVKEQIKGLSDKNEDFIKELMNNEKLANEVKDAFGKDNKAFKKAEVLKTLSKFTGFATTLAIVGIIIPKINIAITRAIHKNDNIGKTAVKPEENTEKKAA